MLTREVRRGDTARRRSWRQSSLVAAWRKAPHRQIVERCGRSRTRGDISVRSHDATVASVGRRRRTEAAGRAARGAAAPDSLHWLLTDGADAALFEWPGGRRPDRIVQVAGVTRNVGLERLSARRSLNDPEKIDLSAQGRERWHRRRNAVRPSSPRTPANMARSTHPTRAGSIRTREATIPASAEVRATLQPGDALAEDDEIALDLASAATGGGWRSMRIVPPRSRPRWPRTLPLSWSPEAAAGVDAVLDCGTRGAGQRRADDPRTGGPHAHAAARGRCSGHPRSPSRAASGSTAERMQVAARLQARPGDVDPLAAGDEPVIVSRAGALETARNLVGFRRRGGAARSRRFRCW